MFFVARNSKPTYTDRLKAGDIPIEERPSPDHRLNPETLEWELVKLPLLERLSLIFEAVPQESAPVEIRAYFRMIQAGVRSALTPVTETAPPDTGAAKYLIQTATLPGDTWTEGYQLPPELQPFQQALLAEFLTQE